LYLEHPIFKPPKNIGAKIWRYMDFTKFVSLLDTSSLFFARADKLGDQFEGSFSKEDLKKRTSTYDKVSRNLLTLYSKANESQVRRVAINSWHLNQYESAAMWRLYLKSNEGIAIQSRVKKLKDSLKTEFGVYICKVKYIDYDKDTIKLNDSFDSFFYKRKSFGNERELRAIIPKNSPFRIGFLNTFEGLYIPVDLKILVENIYLAPSSPKWLYNLVVSITEKYELNKPVLQSKLDEKPIY
jgi:hypothetical protein